MSSIKLRRKLANRSLRQAGIADPFLAFQAEGAVAVAPVRDKDSETVGWRVVRGSGGWRGPPPQLAERPRKGESTGAHLAVPSQGLQPRGRDHGSWLPGTHGDVYSEQRALGGSARRPGASTGGRSQAKRSATPERAHP